MSVQTGLPACGRLKNFSEYFYDTQRSNPSCSSPTVSWLSPTTLPAAASASFQTLRFSPATSQVTARASSVSPATYSTEDALLQKPTVHHKTSCNRRRVVTSQAESPSVHGGVWEIFLSPSVPGQRTWDWHRSLLMKENREKHQKLSKGQSENIKGAFKTINYNY